MPSDYALLRLRMFSEMHWAFDASPLEDEALDRVWIAEIFTDQHRATFTIEAPNPPRSDYAEIYDI